MNDLKELADRGYYIALTVFPGRVGLYLAEWRGERVNVHYDFDTIEQAIAWAKKEADKYEANTNKGN